MKSLQNDQMKYRKKQQYKEWTTSRFHQRCPKFQKLGLRLNLKEYTSSFAPASQQRIKKLKPTNTRFKQQFD